jgi:hypothetical protein
MHGGGAPDIGRIRIPWKLCWAPLFTLYPARAGTGPLDRGPAP